MLIENKRNNIQSTRSEFKDIEKTVTEIQKRLSQLGYEIGKIDGIQGIKTITATRKFQMDNKLLADGIVGPSTWKYLLSFTS